jgi:HSP20 family protein
MTITRIARRPRVRSPWQEMEEASLRLNRLFSQSGSENGTTQWNPAMNVEETDEALLLSAELPGMTIEDIEIEVKNNVLTVKGEKKDGREEREDRKYHLWERNFGAFDRTFTLPRGVATEKISAEFKDGILSVQIPKAPEAKSRKISIKAEG